VSGSGPRAGSGGRRVALLLLDGELASPAEVRGAARRADWVIAADGGARHAAKLGLEPDFVAGDLDSLPARLPASWKRTVIVGDPDPDRSDLDKALSLARRLGARRVIAAGARGGSLDHELVNLAVLEAAAGLEVELVGGGSARLLGPGRHRPALRRGARFSLLAAPRARARLTGARFPLDGLLVRGARGLGNRAEGAVTLTVRTGRVWLLVPSR